MIQCLKCFGHSIKTSYCAGLNLNWLPRLSILLHTYNACLVLSHVRFPLYCIQSSTGCQAGGVVYPLTLFLWKHIKTLPAWLWRAWLLKRQGTKLAQTLSPLKSLGTNWVSPDLIPINQPRVSSMASVGLCIIPLNYLLCELLLAKVLYNVRQTSLCMSWV